ncbi:MAG: hypothetical protein HC874_25835 [Richelia sp. SL_2_1]|nr:hypothetical protein [Richelia sp. SL_2_1]
MLQKINEKISKGFILPSAAYTVESKYLKFYKPLEDLPQIGDVVYGVVSRIGLHRELENKSGRIHQIQDGVKGIFVFGNRYAPDYYEGLIPTEIEEEVDLLARSGVIGTVKTKNSKVIDPTRIKILGQVYDENENKINTKSFCLITPKIPVKKYPRSRLILVCGTAMNSGKSMAAVACCWSLTTLGYGVRACKVTGVASLKDILYMNDAGANPYADFSYLGYPSTYLISEAEVLDIFNKLDLKYANNKENYWVVEIADGINQRETAMLLQSRDVQSRIHKLIFCAADAFGAIGGLKVLNQKFGLTPDAISGICSSSPLHIKELSEYTDIPVFDSMNIQLTQMKEILTYNQMEKPLHAIV